MGKTTKNVYETLYRKMENEFDQFIKRLETSKPADIIEASYEKVMKEDILFMFSEDIIGTEDDAVKLLSIDMPLDFCYESWRNSDISYMGMLKECIEEAVKEI